ncbi:peptidyl-prolyl cis-trans isomerase [bacterium]|nr:peptidyl-prolyl cis-trans isomerase [bacterium]
MIKHWKAFCVTIALLLPVMWGCGKKEATLARIGKQITISVEDFREANTRFRKGESFEEDLEKLKTELKEMIDSKLILLGAYEAGYDQDSTVLAEKQSAEIQESIQKLYQHEIVNKYVLESDIRDYYIKTGRQVVVRNILIEVPPQSDSVVVDLIKRDAEALLRKLRNGESFEFLASKHSQDRRTAINGGLIGTLKYADIGDPIQEAAFSMKQGEISDIIQTKKGFNILKVEEIQNIDQKPYFDAREGIKSAIARHKRQAINEYAGKYWDKLKESKKVQLYNENIDSVFQIIITWNTFITDSVLTGLADLPDSIRNMTLLSYKGGEVKVSDFEHWIKQVMVEPDIRGGITRMRTFEKMLDNLLMGDLLYETAKQKGLDEYPDVQKKVRKAYERKMIQLFIQREIWGTIDPSEEDIVQYYREHIEDKYTQPSRYQLQEIVVETEELAEQIVAWAKAGQRFSTLVQKYSVKPGKERNQGIEENVTKKRKPKHFAYADSLSVGDIGGPIKLRENRYSVIKVLERTAPSPRPFEKIKGRVRIHLTNDIKRERKSQWLEDKRAAVNIMTDDAKLEEILESYYGDESS